MYVNNNCYIDSTVKKEENPDHLGDTHKRVVTGNFITFSHIHNLIICSPSCSNSKKTAISIAWVF